MFAGWRIVGTSVVGLAVGQTAIAFLTLGVFIKPLSDEFGWGRADIAFALSLGAIALAVATPVVGRLIDTYGVRRMLIPSMAIYGLVLSSLYLLTSSIWHLYAVFFLISMLGAAANNVSYVRILSAWFIRRRGLALGIASAGVPLGGAAGAFIAQLLIDFGGWRLAYLGLSSLVLFIGLPIVAVFIRNRPADLGLKPLGWSEHRALPVVGKVEPAIGYLPAQAFRLPVFWALAGVAFLMSAAIHGFQIHLVPFFTDQGISPLVAAGLLTFLSAGAALFGRVFAGYLFDLYFAPRVSMIIFALPATGLILLFIHPSLAVAVLVAMLIGFGAGAESDVLGYMTSRYFGLRSMAELYAYVFAGFMLGTATGPYMYGWVYDSFGAYDFALVMSIVMLLAVCVVMALMPRFPVFAIED